MRGDAVDELDQSLGIVGGRESGNGVSQQRAEARYMERASRLMSGAGIVEDIGGRGDLHRDYRNNRRWADARWIGIDPGLWHGPQGRRSGAMGGPGPWLANVRAIASLRSAGGAAPRSMAPSNSSAARRFASDARMSKPISWWRKRTR